MHFAGPREFASPATVIDSPSVRDRGIELFDAYELRTCLNCIEFIYGDMIFFSHKFEHL